MPPPPPADAATDMGRELPVALLPEISVPLRLSGFPRVDPPTAADHRVVGDGAAGDGGRALVQRQPPAEAALPPDVPRLPVMVTSSSVIAAYWPSMPQPRRWRPTCRHRP